MNIRPDHIRAFQKEYALGDFLTTTNPKVKKSEKVLNIPTAVLHLLPNYRGTCPFAGTCTSLCLNRAGNVQYLNAKLKARKKRTDAFRNDPNTFMEYLLIELIKFAVKHKDYKMRGCRLNGTSDIKWETQSITVTKAVANYLWDQYRFSIRDRQYRNIFYLLNDCGRFFDYPDMSGRDMFCFYDYTKRTDRNWIFAQYDHYNLTLSVGSTGDVLRAALDNSLNIAAAFNVKRSQPLPKTCTYQGQEFPVIDGDVTDFRPFDPSNRTHIVGLRLKRVPGMTSEMVSNFVLS